MLLALADINHDKRGRQKRQEALELAQEAAAIFREVEDRKSEACTLLVSAMAHYKFLMYDDMLRESQEALEILEELGDKFWQARAHTTVGLAESSQRRLEVAMEHGKAALALWRELGLTRCEAMQRHSMSGWLVVSRQMKQALALSEETVEIFRKLGPAGISGGGGVGYRREAMSLCLCITMLTDLKNYRTALKVGQAGCQRFAEVGSDHCRGMVKESLSRVYACMDKPDKAIEVLDEAREIAERLGDKKWSAKLLSGAAQVHLKSKAVEEAVDTLDKSIGLAQSAGDKQETLRMQQSLIDTLLFRQGNHKAAGRLAKEARVAAQASGNKRAEAGAVLREAMVLQANGKSSEAIQLAKQAQDLFQEGYWPRGEAQCLHFVAEVYFQKNDLEEALVHAEERLAVLREVNDLSLEGLAILQICKLHISDENFAEAEKLAREADKLGKKDKNSRVQIDALLSLCQVFNTQIVNASADDKEKNKALADKSIRSVNEALQIAGKAENKGLRASVLAKRAETMVLSGRFSTASRDIKEAVAIYQEQGSPAHLGRCLVLSAHIKYATGKDEDGEADLDKAAMIASQTGDAALTQEVNNFKKELADRKAEEEMKAQVQIQQPQLQAAPAPGQPATEAAAPAAAVSAAPPAAKGLDPVHVRKQLAAMVKDAVASDEDLELDSPFMDAGMDSLSSVALMSMVAKEFQMALSPSLVFDFPTLRAMEEHLVQESQG
eukprot:TRINITY_DN60957_c0_g1_i1.p1 TRINITY_DN60957_c0_g1~~TRINITY_DN60957_c0_g1_i1.p1  ORF type:complete len:836 (+),score=247.31 TRINITY_DN60957_c0_g1_i1:337-2508(+)